ncbi:MAG: hypothetical protein R2864_09215 [Syntrophotaleaceae bacterium]
MKGNEKSPPVDPVALLEPIDFLQRLPGVVSAHRLPGQDELFGAVNLIFRIDPLVAPVATLATRAFIALLVPGFAAPGQPATGPLVCGWVCPMGTPARLAAHPLYGQRGKVLPAALPRLRYILLLLILVGALFGLPLIGFFDPFAILVRVA